MTTGPGRPSTVARTACSSTSAAVSASVSSPAHLARPPIVWTRSTSWNASRPRRPRSTWPTRTNIAVESAVAVWMPMARLDAPTARVPRHAAGRPVSWPYASAAKAAAPSWRVATTRIPAAASASRMPRKLSPATVKAIRTPAARRVAATSSATVVGSGWAAATGSGSRVVGPRRGRRPRGRRRPARAGRPRPGRSGRGLGLGRRLGLGSQARARARAPTRVRARASGRSRPRPPGRAAAPQRRRLRVERGLRLGLGRRRRRLDPPVRIGPRVRRVLGFGGLLLVDAGATSPPSAAPRDR